MPMIPRTRSIASLLLAVLLAGCASSTNGSPSPAPTQVAAPTALETTASTVAPSPIATPAPTATPVALATPVPPEAAVGWTGIAWRTLAADDPLAQIRNVTTWRGGYVGRGDPVAIDGAAPASGDANVHTPLWVSTDGRSWERLDTDAIGPGIVVGMARRLDGVVALAADAGPTIVDEETEARSWPSTGPLHVWTSPDGRTWTARPGSDIALADMSLTVDDGMDRLKASTAPLLLIADGPTPSFVSVDGIVWTRATSSGLPKPRSRTFEAFGAGFLAVDDSAIASSSDGRTWTTQALPAPCRTSQVYVARDGLIGIGSTEVNGRGVSSSIWCSSPDGRTWRQLKKLQPLGFMNEPGSQECLDACADGTLIGDGLRMIAYRGWGDVQAGWTSFDGRTWQALTFEGRPERSSGWLDDQCTQSLVLLPMGLRCRATGDAIWFGEARS
jgi:hypothetical protein